jgi:hypothetical protein
MQIALIWHRIAPEYGAILIARMDEETLRITDLLTKVGRCFAAKADAAIHACWAKRRIPLAIRIVSLTGGRLGGRRRGQGGSDREYRKELKHSKPSRKNWGT